MHAVGARTVMDVAHAKVDSVLCGKIEVELPTISIVGICQQLVSQ